MRMKGPSISRSMASRPQPSGRRLRPAGEPGFCRRQASRSRRRRSRPERVARFRRALSPWRRSARVTPSSCRRLATGCVSSASYSGRMRAWASTIVHAASRAWRRPFPAQARYSRRPPPQAFPAGDFSASASVDEITVPPNGRFGSPAAVGPGGNDYLLGADNLQADFGLDFDRLAVREPRPALDYFDAAPFSGGRKRRC